MHLSLQFICDLFIKSFNKNKDNSNKIKIKSLNILNIHILLKNVFYKINGNLLLNQSSITNIKFNGKLIRIK